MRKASIDYLLHDFEIYVKDDDEVAHYLNDCVTPTINKLLKKENQDKAWTVQLAKSMSVQRG